MPFTIVSSSTHDSYDDDFSESMPLRTLSPLVLAAWQTERAFLGLVPLPLSPPPTVQARSDYLTYSKARNPEGNIAIGILTLLSWFERPFWCVPENRNSSGSSALYTTSCVLPSGTDQIYLSNLPYLSPAVTLPIEIASSLFLLHLSILERRSLASLHSPPTIGSRVRLIAPILCLLDALHRLSASTSASGRTSYPFTYSLYVRPLLLAATPGVTSVLTSSRRLLPPFTAALTLYLSASLFFGWVLTMVTDDFSSKVPSCAYTGSGDCPAGNAGYATLEEGIYTTLTTATGAR